MVLTILHRHTLLYMQLRNCLELVRGTPRPLWIPACAGMTIRGFSELDGRSPI